MKIPLIIFAFVLSFTLAFLVFQQVNMTTWTLTTPLPNSPSDNAWTNDSTPDFSFTATSDTNATDILCELFIDSTSYGSKSDVNSGAEATITASSSLNEGDHSWQIRCTDVNGSLDSETRTIKIDTQAPATTDNSTSSWTSSDQTISLNCSDTGSGCNQTIYCTDTSNSCTPNTSGATASITCASNSTCQKYLRYRSTDSAGNPEAIKSAQIRIDKQAPITTASAKIDDRSYIFETWANDSVKITLSCSDSSGAGCDKTLYCKDTNNSCAPSTVYSSSVTISTENVSYIRYASNDTLNNTESNKSSKLKIDSDDPSATLTLSSASITKGTSTALNCTVNDTLSGIKNITLRSDNLQIKACSSSPCTTTYTPTTVKDYEIACTAYDNALNNKKATKTLEVKNQTTATTGTGVASVGNKSISTKNQTQTPAEPQEPAQPQQNQTENETNETYTPSEADIDYDLGALHEAKVTVAKGEIIGFETHEEHMLRIDSIETDHILVTAWSDPVHVAISVNQTEQIELDGSTVTITLLEIKDGKAVLDISVEKSLFKFPKIGWWFWPLVILVVLIILWLVYPTLPRERKKSKVKGKKR
jgi:hypothetical protein